MTLRLAPPPAPHTPAKARRARRSPPWLVGLLLAGASVLAVGAPAFADTTLDPEAAELARHSTAQRYRHKTVSPASRIDTGGAAIMIHAPIADVRRIVEDYRHYAKFIRPFQQSRVLAKKNGQTDVYLEVPIAHGAAHVWAVVRMKPPVKDGAGEKIAGDYVKGNVDGFRAEWLLRAVDEQTTIAKLEIFVDPKMPLPASLITPELEYAADQGVTAVRDRAENRVAELPAPSPGKSGIPQHNIAER